MSRNKLLQLKIQNDSMKCLKACVKDETWLWHMTYGHLKFGGLKLLSSKIMVKQLPWINHRKQFCEKVLARKITKIRFFPQ